MGELQIKRFTLGELQTNCFVVIDPNENNCIIVDPGENPEDVLQFVNNRKVDYILLTHAHHDHIAGLNELRKQTNALVVIHHEEAQWLIDPILNLSNRQQRRIVCDWPDIVLYGGEVIKWNDQSIKAIHTPGHSPGSMCYLIGDYLFSGDTLLEGLIGTTEIPYGDRELLKKSIKDRLFTLDDRVKVLPGHGRETTIGNERKYNVFPKIKRFSF